MFTFQKEQKVFNFSGIKIGGQPGENPPLMISSMFHNKDRIVQDRKGNFDKVRAKEIILQQEEMSRVTGVPGMVAMVANTPDEAKVGCVSRGDRKRGRHQRRCKYFLHRQPL